MIKAVLHIDHSSGKNINMGLDLSLECIERLRMADPQAAIVVVATATGVKELEQNRDSQIAKWHHAGVMFVACEYSYRKHKFEPLSDGVQLVHDGLVYVLELQADGYSYIKVASCG